MADLYDTAVLLGLIESAPANPQHLLRTFYGATQTEESEDIHFDVIKRGRAVAPFVSPLVEGQIVRAAGYSTKTFRPAYVKPKSVINPRRALKRAPGEQPLGRLSLAQREQLHVRDAMRDHRSQIERRLEVMAAEATVFARVTVVGEKYPEVVVDFGRDPELSIAALTTTAKWTHADSKPLDNIETWCQRVLRIEGVVVTDVYMTLDAWNAFAAHAQVKEAMETRRFIRGQIDSTRPSDVGAVYRGQVDGRNIWTYQDWYLDPLTGTEQPMVPDGYVFGVSSAIDGVQAYGAVAVAEGDDQIRLMAEPFVPSAWVEKDPPVRIVMTQSAPLVVPTRPDSTFACKVV